MHKQKKQFIIILVLLVICVVAYIGICIYNDKQAEKTAAKEEAATIHITDMDVEDVTAFSYIYNEETISFVKEDDTWYDENDRSISIDQDAIETMLTTAVAITTTDAITDYDDTSEYGIDNPSTVITITTADGTTTLTIGSENSMLSQYYLMKDGDDSLYLVESSVYTVFQKSVEDLIATEETTEEPAEAENSISNAMEAVTTTETK